MNSSTAPTPTPSSPAPVVPATAERGWRKLLLGLALFVFLPTTVPQFRVLFPVDQTIFLLVPALAVCCLVGWWAGGRAYLALVWSGIAALLMWNHTPVDAFHTLLRGWSLLMAGAFGMVCLLARGRSLFSRALVSLAVVLAFALTMGAVGPVGMRDARQTVARELARRNTETMAAVNQALTKYSREWKDVTAKVPAATEMPAQFEKQLTSIASVSVEVFPALLALESLAALAIAWSLYHRLARARLGAPLRPLREFRFNDQLVWGLIVGLTTLVLPTLQSFRGTGRNLVLFFGALYAIRGLGVLAWFLAPAAVTTALAVGFAMLWLPVVQMFAILAFLFILITAFALGLGDTWADWRHRARHTS